MQMESKITNFFKPLKEDEEPPPRKKQHVARPKKSSRPVGRPRKQVVNLVTGLRHISTIGLQLEGALLNMRHLDLVLIFLSPIGAPSGSHIVFTRRLK